MGMTLVQAETLANHLSIKLTDSVVTIKAAVVRTAKTYIDKAKLGVDNGLISYHKGTTAPLTFKEYKTLCNYMTVALRRRILPSVRPGSNLLAYPELRFNECTGELTLWLVSGFYMTGV